MWLELTVLAVSYLCSFSCCQLPYSLSLIDDLDEEDDDGGGSAGGLGSFVTGVFDDLTGDYDDPEDHALDAETAGSLSGGVSAAEGTTSMHIQMVRLIIGLCCHCI